MKEQDTLQRFLFEHANIRGEIARINKPYTTIIQQRVYPPMVQNLLGQALVACVLLTGSLKFQGEVVLQFQGDQRLPLLVVQCDNNLNLRAFAKFEENLTDKDYAAAFLHGTLALTINPHHTTQSYQSIVPVHSTDMSENLMLYFAQSEQISTQVTIAISDESAAGMILQLMPTESTQEREAFWEYAVLLNQTLKADELLNTPNAVILHRLYHETEVRLFEGRAIQFKCRCSSDKMKQVINTLGKADALQLLQEKGVIEATCEFCNQHYTFDAIDIALLFPD